MNECSLSSQYPSLFYPISITDSFFSEWDKIVWSLLTSALQWPVRRLAGKRHVIKHRGMNEWIGELLGAGIFLDSTLSDFVMPLSKIRKTDMLEGK